MIVVATNCDFREVGIVGNVGTVVDNDAWDKFVSDGEVFAACSCWGWSEISWGWYDSNVNGAVRGFNRACMEPGHRGREWSYMRT